MAPHDDLTPEADYEATVRTAARRRLRVAAALVCALGVALVLSRQGAAIAAWTRGETDLRGHRRYAPRHPVDRAALRRVDFARVHAQLLPRWLVALQRADTPAGDRRAVEALAALRRAIAPDRNLDAIVTELDARVRDDLAGNSARVRYLLWAWGAYLDRAGVPYRVEGTVLRRRWRASLRFRAYRVVDDAPVAVGARAYRARLLRRVDGTNLREADLGHAGEADEGALVVIDTVFRLAADEVWPMLDAADDVHRAPLERAHAAAVRAEAASVLAPEDHARLARTAHARFVMVNAASAINARSWCSAVPAIGHVPWWGYTPELAARARAVAAEAPEDPDCPPMLPEEAEDFASGSVAVRAEAGLDRSLAALVTWLARAVTVHEVRHVADDWEVDGLRTPLACDDCPRALGTSGRAELAAYLASFGTPGVGRVSFYQACRAAGGGVGPHGAALRVANKEVGACLAPPRDLYGAARRAERALFGRATSVTLPPARSVAGLVPTRR